MISILKISKGNNSAKRFNFNTNHIQNYKAGNTLEGDVSDVIALDQPTSAKYGV